MNIINFRIPDFMVPFICLSFSFIIKLNISGSASSNDLYKFPFSSFQIHVGTFTSMIEAVEAYDMAALRNEPGDRVRLNRPHMRAEPERFLRSVLQNGFLSNWRNFWRLTSGRSCNYTSTTNRQSRLWTNSIRYPVSRTAHSGKHSLLAGGSITVQLWPIL